MHQQPVREGWPGNSWPPVLTSLVCLAPGPWGHGAPGAGGVCVNMPMKPTVVTARPSNGANHRGAAPGEDFLERK